MRARLWKCAADQCRPATADEALGAQMLSEESLAALRQQARGVAAAAPAAVDVEREGSPPEEAWRRHE
eukprot:6241754-Alexandrium_andersonii.AAC.1